LSNLPGNPIQIRREHQNHDYTIRVAARATNPHATSFNNFVTQNPTAARRLEGDLHQIVLKQSSFKLFIFTLDTPKTEA